MARAKMDQWNLRFGITRNLAGYAWQVKPGPGEPVVLAPAGTYEEPVTGKQVMYGPRRQTEGRSGLAIARRAYQRFRALALAFEDCDDEEWARKLIVDYANVFGTLWGDNEPRTLDWWRLEALTFLDVTDIAAAIASGGKSRAFNDHVRIWGGGQFITYVSPRPHGRRYPIVSKGKTNEYRDDDGGPIIENVDWFEWFNGASSIQRARYLFRKIINEELSGGLSLEADFRAPGKAVITPNELIHLLYVRMWLDADMDRDPIRLCEKCGEHELEGKQRRFCSDKCRQKHYRRSKSA